MKRPFRERAFIVLWCLWGLWVSATFYYFGRFPTPNRSSEGLTIINIVFLHGELIAFLAGAPVILIALLQYLVVGFSNPLRLFGEGLTGLLWLLCWSWAGLITYSHIQTWEFADDPISPGFASVFGGRVQITAGRPGQEAYATSQIPQGVLDAYTQNRMTEADRRLFEHHALQGTIQTPQGFQIGRTPALGTPLGAMTPAERALVRSLPQEPILTPRPDSLDPLASGPKQALIRQLRNEARLEAFLVAFVPMVFLFLLQLE